MPQVDQYVADVRVLRDDNDTLNFLYDRLGNAQTLGDTALNLPGDIADYLDTRVTAVDLPNVIVNALGNLPYGIGFAIRQLNTVSNTVGYTIERQVDVMEALDRAWQPAQIASDVLGRTLTAIGQLRATVTASIDNRAFEADLLEATMGGQIVPNRFELGARMADFSAGLQPWLETKAALLAPVETALAAYETAIARIEALLPDLPEIRAAMNEALAVFTSAADIARDIYDALDIDITIWPLPTWNLIDAIDAISSFAGFVQNAIEDIVIGILNGLGFNTNIFGFVQDAIDEILDPLFAAFDTIQAAAESFVAAALEALESLDDRVEELYLAMSEAVGLTTLFETEIVAPSDAGEVLTGTEADDGIFGAAGNDTLTGEDGDDFLFGAAGDDRFEGGAGNDEMFGGAGNDTFIGGAGSDDVDGGPGVDSAYLASGIDDVQIVDGGGAWIYVVDGEATDRFWRVEKFRFAGTDYTAAELRAMADARVVTGGAGNDLLTGTAGDDTLLGLAGNDTLEGGAGGDHLDGGAGRDVASYVSATRSVRVDLLNDAFMYGDAVGDTFANVEVFQTGGTVDQLRGDNAANEFYTGGLSDRLYGRQGDDRLFGEDGADALYGGMGADTMSGGDQEDRRDRYIYFNIAESRPGDGNRDVITDFVAGEDRIEIKRFDADTTQGFKQAFTFVGDAATLGAGEVGYRHEGGNTIVQAEVTGDGIPDFEIELTGVMTLTAGDFLI
ncbi:calcium-binding protein [Salipiger mucosus]|uniref:Alkaline phosphatase n=1 Tax=Salipiger mucosus DSM 16094 TaxID=1123237 RepID=S9Q6K8_9RHOB|nr:calcium-binding protein [Salipiger mucosus]EPX75632.1 Alkaline phosphatase [Salipiger mucosus DSM 16094]